MELQAYLPYLADVDYAIDAFISEERSDELVRCMNSSVYDDAWKIYCGVHTKTELWDVLRRNKSEQKSRLRPNEEIFARCCKRSPTAFAPCVTLIYAYRGEVSCEIGNRSLTLREHELCICNADKLQVFQSAEPDGFFTRICFNKMYLNNVFLKQYPCPDIFSPFFEQTLFGAPRNMDFLVFSLADAEKAVQYYMDAIDNYLRKPVYYQEIGNSLIFLLICELQHIASSSGPKDKPISSFVTAYDIADYVNQNIKDVTLEHMARHFHFTQDYMRKLIKKLTNQSYTELVQDARMTTARKLIQTTDLPIGEIIDNCGYSNHTHFYSIFKRKYNCTPAEYRAETPAE